MGHFLHPLARKPPSGYSLTNRFPFQGGFEVPFIRHLGLHAQSRGSLYTALFT